MLRRFWPETALIITAGLLSFPAAPHGCAEEPLPQIERLQSSPVLRHLKKNPGVAEKSTAAATVAQMYVPEGFEVNVVASEPDVRQPIAFAWDERGRIWIAEAFSYPARRAEGEGLDRIIILSDADGDGQFETKKIFVEKLNLVSGLEVGHGGVWVGAAPELLFIPDRDRNDKPDGAAEVLLDGFGYQDTHETLNSFLWGPDGWLYGIQGVFNTARIGKPGIPPAQRPELRAGVWRFHPVRREFEVFAHGGSNPWGLDYDEHGELFMTHCRSYWGRGLTTHVIQGGQFWNQVNANYAPYIVANAPREFPGFRNFLLASARYDHGAGGAGVRGSDAIYGGHSHVGTMIYLGDNWPDDYRGKLFTHNLGGHQINQQINKPLGSGYDTVHAGRDVLFCTDPKYVAVDLQYGPDGAVYFIDWYDQQHCHNPNTERWDRGNGRVYRMHWQAGYKPVRIDLGGKSDVELVSLLDHRNAWFARTARRLLHERAQTDNGVAGAAKEALRESFTGASNAVERLNALWTLNQTGGLTEDLLLNAFSDADPFVRGWAVQVAAESRNVSSGLGRRLISAAQHDSSPVVRRYLASAVQRVPRDIAWKLIDALSQHSEDSDDRNLPYLLWHGMATRWAEYPGESERAFEIARTATLRPLADWIHWYAATLEGEALNRVVRMLEEVKGAELHRRLAGLWLAMEPRANVPMPPSWKQIAPLLYQGDASVQRLAEKLAAAFGDATAFPRLRSVLAHKGAERAARDHSFEVLSRAQDRPALPVFIGLLDENVFRTRAISLVARFDAPEVSSALIDRFESFNTSDRAAALAALTTRPAFAMALLEAVAGGKVARDQITAFTVRQLTDLKNAAVDQRVRTMWGRIGQTPVEKQNQISRLEKEFNEAPLWAYNGGAGREHFQKLCASCHKVGNEGTQLGPELTGAGKHGVRYFLENIIDPDAVIGTDFQQTIIETRDDESLSGLLVNETASAVTLRTTVGETVIPKAGIKLRSTSEKSLMPEALLDSMSARERIELLKFLTSN